MSKEIERLRTPTADNTIDLFFRDVLGSKSDAAAEGAVTTTDTLVAYIKQIVSASAGTTSLPVAVPEADAETNAYSRDVIGNKEDVAATGVVTDTSTIVGYIKQLVGDVIDILADTGTDGVVLGADAITAAKIADDAISEEHFDGDAVQAVTMGKQVSKATAALAATSTVDLFTIAGGRVVIHAIIGEVTTVVQSQETLCKLISTPTTGTAVDLCIASDLTGDEAGCLYGITGLFSEALVGSAAGATVAPRNPIVLPIGTIGFANGSAVNTGSVKWDVYYTPLDSGATITSA